MNPLSYFDPDNPYPESDGQPMAEHTGQCEGIVKTKKLSWREKSPTHTCCPRAAPKPT